MQEHITLVQELKITVYKNDIWKSNDLVSFFTKTTNYQHCKKQGRYIEGPAFQHNMTNTICGKFHLLQT